MSLPAEHRDHDRARRGLAVELADQRERRLQPRDADGESGRRHRLAAEARDEAVVTPSPADRAEPHRPALLVRCRNEFSIQLRRPVQCSIRAREPLTFQLKMMRLDS